MRASTEGTEDLSGPAQDWLRRCYEMAEEWESPFCQCDNAIDYEEAGSNKCKSCGKPIS